MAGISAALEVTDRMTSPLNRIISSLYQTTSAFETVDSASERAFNPSAVQAVAQELYGYDQRIQTLEKDLSDANEKIAKMEEETKNAKSSAEALEKKFKQIVGAVASIATVMKTISFVKDTMSDYDAQIEAETKLTTVMRQRMGATNEMIQSVKDLTSQQQKLGVVGDEVQLAGAQQLATFLNSSDALNSLIPAMNNLAVQQNGASVTGENMTSIANMMGKAMQGQATALTRVGITMTDAQKKTIEEGNEMERAAMLAQIITDNVGNMNEAIAKTPQGQIQQMKNAWGDIRETIGGRLYPVIIRFFQKIQQKMPQIQRVLDVFVNTIQFIVNIMSVIIDVAGAIADVIINNWSWIEPIIMVIVTALGIYYGILFAVKAAETVAAIAKGALAIATGIATGAQWGLNAAFYACPLFWIILLVVALIYALIKLCDWIAETTGCAQSGIGVICGALFAAGAFIGNIFKAIWNVAVDIFGALWNLVAAFANFFGNVFNHPIDSICRLFIDMADFILSICVSIAEALDTIFGTSGAGQYKQMQDDMNAWAERTFDSPEEVVMEKFDSEKHHFDRFDYGEAWDSGVAIGDGIAKTIDDFSIDDLFKNEELEKYDPYNGGLGGIGGDIEDIAGDTGNISDSLDISNEDLKYLRDIAEQEAINRFTTAEIKVDMTNHNTVNSGMDIDGMVSALSSGVQSAMSEIAEGVHA